MAELQFKQQTCWVLVGTLLPLKQLSGAGANPDIAGYTAPGCEPPVGPPGAGVQNVMVSPCLFFSFTGPAQIPGGGDGAG